MKGIISREEEMLDFKSFMVINSRDPPEKSMLILEEEMKRNISKYIEIGYDQYLKMDKKMRIIPLKMVSI